MIAPHPTRREVTVGDQILAGLALGGVVLVWLVLLIPCSIWLLISLLFPAPRNSYE